MIDKDSVKSKMYYSATQLKHLILPSLKTYISCPKHFASYYLKYFQVEIYLPWPPWLLINKSQVTSWRQLQTQTSKVEQISAPYIISGDGALLGCPSSVATFASCDAAQ